MSLGRRRRGLVLLALATAFGGLASSEVSSRAREADRRVGPAVSVVVATRDIPRGRSLDGRTTERLLELREVPARFVPPDALAAPEQAEGGRLAAPVPAGGYLTAGHLEEGAGPEEDGPGLRRGERALDVRVAGAGELAEAVGGRSRVDVLVTSESGAGRGRTYLALEDVELLGSRAAAEEAGAGQGGGAAGATIATLRVTVRQAVFLTAAQNFAREVRLLARTPGERGRARAGTVSAADL